MKSTRYMIGDIDVNLYVEVQKEGTIVGYPELRNEESTPLEKIVAQSYHQLYSQLKEKVLSL